VQSTICGLRVIYKWFGICKFSHSYSNTIYIYIGLLYHDSHKRINIMKGVIKKAANQESLFYWHELFHAFDKRHEYL